VIEGGFGLAFALGMVAAFNPCGFAMLPAYLSYFLGLEDQSPDAEAGVLRALGVGASVTLGFTLVFLAIGIPIAAFSLSIERWLSYATVAIGLGIVVLGIAMLRGFEPTVGLPKLDKGGTTRQFSSMFLFGVSYGVASIGCFMPVFVVQVVNSVTASGLGSKVVLSGAFALGMGLVLMTLTLALALARRGIVQRMRSLLPYVNRIAGGLLVLSGLYVAYYGWWEIRVIRGGSSVGPAEQFTRWNDEVRQWIIDTGPMRIGIVLAGLIAIALVLSIGWRYSNRHAR
jgi:cytochrome c biogenesis protein CcdA